MHLVHQTQVIKFMWSMFVLSCSIFVLSLMANVVGWQWIELEFWHALILGLPALTVFLHAVITMSFARASLLFILAGVTGFIFESIGLKYGVFFGGSYTYTPNLTALFNVPLTVIVYWGVFTYCGYSVINSFLVWFHKTKPVRLQAPWWHVLVLASLDALLVLCIDIFMDPLMMAQGTWTWHGGGSYFHVPIGNFIGWYIVAFIIVISVRTLEYVRPLPLPKLPSSIHLIPILGYATIAASLTLMGLSLGMYAVVAIGLTLMLTVVFSNLFLYRRFQNTEQSFGLRLG